MPLSIALFIYGPPVLMVLAIAYMVGCGSERRRSRDLYYTNEQLNHAVKKSYRLGLRRGHGGALARHTGAHQCALRSTGLVLRCGNRQCGQGTDQAAGGRGWFGGTSP